MERFESLPDDLKSAVTSQEVDKQIQEIAKKHLLHIDQTGELADETGLVMLGLTKTDEYISNLKERLGISQQKTAEIAKDIDEQVLRPIKASLVAASERKMETARTSEQPEQEEILDREQIMKEIDEHLQDDEKRLTINGGQLTVSGSQQIAKPQEPTPASVPVTPPVQTGLPAALRSAQTGIVEKKLTEPVKIPKEETVIDRTKNRYGGQDPYREPVE